MLARRSDELEPFRARSDDPRRQAHGSSSGAADAGSPPAPLVAAAVAVSAALVQAPLLTIKPSATLSLTPLSQRLAARAGEWSQCRAET